MNFIADLHCDLLWYLSLDSKRTPNDLNVRCAIPQLKEGKVALQTLAIFSETEINSVHNGQKQAEIFKVFPRFIPKVFNWCGKKKI